MLENRFVSFFSGELFLFLRETSFHEAGFCLQVYAVGLAKRNKVLPNQRLSNKKIPAPIQEVMRSNLGCSWEDTLIVSHGSDLVCL